MDIKTIASLITEDVRKDSGLVLEAKCPGCGAPQQEPCPNPQCSYSLAARAATPAPAPVKKVTGGVYFSDDLTRLAKTRDIGQVTDESDSSCALGVDYDSTGWENFEYAYDLFKRAGNRDIWAFDLEGIRYFYIGSPDEVRKRLENLDTK